MFFDQKILTSRLFLIMVVTHVPMEVLEGPSSERKKRNRRKITRKNPHTSKSNPSSIHQDRDDETMPEADEAFVSPDADRIPAGLEENDDGQIMIGLDASLLPQNLTGAPLFARVAPGTDKTTLKSETRRIPIPPHRMTPLKKDWLNIFGPLTEILGLQIRMNVQRRCVEIRVRDLLLLLIKKSIARHTDIERDERCRISTERR